MKIEIHPFHTYPSTYLAICSFALTGFMAYPSFGSFIVHMANAGLLALVLWVAHWEGRNVRKVVD
jgi:hypothetical protein